MLFGCLHPRQSTLLSPACSKHTFHGRGHITIRINNHSRCIDQTLGDNNICHIFLEFFLEPADEFIKFFFFKARLALSLLILALFIFLIKGDISSISRDKLLPIKLTQMAKDKIVNWIEGINNLDILFLKHLNVWSRFNCSTTWSVDIVDFLLLRIHAKHVIGK